MMKSLLFSLTVLSLTIFVHTVPCYQNRCGGDNYMGAPSLGYGNANVEGGGGGYEVGEENGGDGAGYGGGGEEYNGGGGQYQMSGGGGYNGGSGQYQGGSGSGYHGGGGQYQGGSGGYNGEGGYNPPRRNNYCPNCYVQHFGNGKNNANTINIKHRRN